jgi:hypothetical protein
MDFNFVLEAITFVGNGILSIIPQLINSSINGAGAAIGAYFITKHLLGNTEKVLEKMKEELKDLKNMRSKTEVVVEKKENAPTA